jgi:hypothetical protein
MLRVDEETLEESWKLYKTRGMGTRFHGRYMCDPGPDMWVGDVFTYNAREFRPVNLNVVTNL